MSELLTAEEIARASPADLAKEAQRRELAAIRKKAWITRREKYGPRGHDGSYSR